jgi:hypothetical protein
MNFGEGEIVYWSIGETRGKYVFGALRNVKS